MDFIVGQTVAHGLRNGAHPVRCLQADRLDHSGFVWRAFDLYLIKSGQIAFHRGQRFLQALVDGAANGHGFAHRFHRGGQVWFGAGEFFKGELWNFGDNIVDGWLKRRRRHFGDVVVEFVQRVAHGQFGGDFGNRETRRFRRQRRRARHAWVHLDHHHTAIGRVHRPLHVGSAGFHANFAQHRNRVVAHGLVFFVRQRQGRRHGDTVAGVHAHRVDILDGTNDDGVVRFVAHNFHLKFFPTQQAFIHQNLVHRGSVHAGATEMDVVLAVIGHTAAGAAHGEGGADDGGQADAIEFFQRQPDALIKIGRSVVPFWGCHNGGARIFDAQPVHGFAEQFAVLGHFDGVAGCANHLNAKFLQHAHFFQRQRGVQAGLATHGGQQRVRAFFLDDFGNHFGGDRLDVGGVCKTGVGHDGRGVGVHQNNAVAFFAQGLTGLCAGVVKLAGLADHNRTGPDDHDRGDICSFGHGGPQAMWAAAGESPECANCRGL